MSIKKELGIEIFRIVGVSSKAKNSEGTNLFIAYENGIFLRSDELMLYVEMEDISLIREVEITVDEVMWKGIECYFIQNGEVNTYELSEEIFPNIVAKIENLFKNEWLKCKTNYMRFVTSNKMSIRVFVDTTDFKKAEEIFYDVIEGLKPYIKDLCITNIEAYWKIEGVTIVSADFELFNELGLNDKEKFLGSIANNWELYNDENEAVISYTMDNCEIYKKDIIFVNIDFNVLRENI